MNKAHFVKLQKSKVTSGSALVALVAVNELVDTGIFASSGDRTAEILYGSLTDTFTGFVSGMIFSGHILPPMFWDIPMSSRHSFNMPLHHSDRVPKLPNDLFSVAHVTDSSANVS